MKVTVRRVHCCSVRITQQLSIEQQSVSFSVDVKATIMCSVFTPVAYFLMHLNAKIMFFNDLCIFICAPCWRLNC
jgi:hypothetical protein